VKKVQPLGLLLLKAEKDLNNNKTVAQGPSPYTAAGSGKKRH